MMQFHHHGYVSTDPRVRAAVGTGIDRPEELPAEVDVLVVGTGPAGMLLAAQLAEYPSITTRVVERRTGRLRIGHADGIQARSVETFQAFGFAERITAEAYEITAMNFWTPDPNDPSKIVRTQRTDDATSRFSEFPHLIVNQARVLDYFAECARNAPARIVPDWGWEFVDLTMVGGERPVQVRLRRTRGEYDRDTESFIDLDPDTDVDARAGNEMRTVRAKYVVGCDGARSAVRAAIGRRMRGEAAMHAWAVMDVLAETDFPDIRTKCAIQSSHGSILHIPREGGYLFRMYVDLGEVDGDDATHAVRSTTAETAIETANKILAPFSLDVRDVAWYSVYEVGHRVTDKFDDVPDGEEDMRTPRVFICGDACHTHSAKAGQGMNVSMQDGFNLGWKLGSVLTGLATESLLSTYDAERRQIAIDLIEFDRQWSELMAKKPEEFDHPEDLGDFYLRTFEFPTGFMTQYRPSMITGAATHQGLATGFPIGKRFRSELVTRVADVNAIHLGHHARADGRWRLYAFADAGRTALGQWAEWLASAPDSPVRQHTPRDADLDAVFDVKVIYPATCEEVDLAEVPRIFLPHQGPFRLIDYEKVYACHRETDIFDTRGIDPGGAVVVVRPDQYVAHVLPLSDTDQLAAFFAGALLAG